VSAACVGLLPASVLEGATAPCECQVQAPESRFLCRLLVPASVLEIWAAAPCECLVLVLLPVPVPVLVLVLVPVLVLCCSWCLAPGACAACVWGCRHLVHVRADARAGVVGSLLTLPSLLPPACLYRWAPTMPQRALFRRFMLTA